MSKKLLLLVVLAFVVLVQPKMWAQEAPAFGIKFKGFVKLDAFFDSRQTVAVREGHLLLYPQPEVKDDNGDDINATPNFNMLAVQTRLTGVITGPEAFGAKSSGVIEGAFFGHSNPDINGFRLRHAFVKLQWERTSLMFGQYWHPMFVTQCFPGVVSFNTGMPIAPFSRNPQIRLTQQMGESATLILAAISQRDFTSTGPSGGTSTYLRNAVVPNLHAQLQLKAGGHLFGAGVDYKMLKPMLTYTDGAGNTLKSNNTVSGLSLIGYAKLGLGSSTLKVEGVLGQNLTDLVMLGGYAVKASTDPNAEPDYTPIKNLAVWGEFITGKKVQFGLFGGYTKNDGASDPVSAFFARGSNIKDVFRVSPRVVVNSGKSRFAVELEVTSANYQDTSKPNSIDEKGVIQETLGVTNVRLLFAAYQFF